MITLVRCYHYKIYEVLTESYNNFLFVRNVRGWKNSDNDVFFQKIFFYLLVAFLL